MVFAVCGVVYVIQCVCVCSLRVVCSMMCMCGTKCAVQCVYVCSVSIVKCVV